MNNIKYFDKGIEAISKGKIIHAQIRANINTDDVYKVMRYYLLGFTTLSERNEMLCDIYDAAVADTFMQYLDNKYCKA